MRGVKRTQQTGHEIGWLCVFLCVNVTFKRKLIAFAFCGAACRRRACASIFTLLLSARPLESVPFYVAFFLSSPLLPATIKSISIVCGPPPKQLQSNKMTDGFFGFFFFKSIRLRFDDSFVNGLLTVCYWSFKLN